jgi:hypothetical protein
VIIVRAPDPRRIGDRSPESGWVEILGNWPPDTGSMVTQFRLDSAARLASLRTVVDGAPELGEQRVPFGEWIRTVDHRGDPLFEVNASSGSVLVRNHERLVCTLKPRDAGFASGVLLETQGHEPLSIQVSGGAGQLRVAVSGRELETFPAQEERP